MPFTLYLNRKKGHVSLIQVVILMLVSSLLSCGSGGGSGTGSDTPTPIVIEVDWEIDVDSNQPEITLDSALIGQYELSGAALDFENVGGLIDTMSQAGFGAGADWRVSIGRWELGTELFDSLSDGSPCPNILPGSQSNFSSILDLISSRDWFTFDDGSPVGLDDIQDDRFSLDYVRSVIDTASNFGATPFVSIDHMPRALSVTQTPNLTNCSATFTNSVNNNEPMDPNVFAAAVTGLVDRVVEGTGTKTGDDRPRNAQYWEVWNEPEFGFFWEPTLASDPDLFFNMAIPLLLQLDSYRNSSSEQDVQDLKFGIGSFALDETAVSVIQSFDVANIPLDFISFHEYNDDPLVLVEAIEAVQLTLDNSTNYQNLELALAEWGPDLATRAGDHAYATSINPALHAATVILLGSAAGLDRSHNAIFYNYNTSIALGMIDNNGVPRPLYRAYEMMALLIDSNKQRLVVEGMSNGKLDAGLGAQMVTRDILTGEVKALFVNRNSSVRIVRMSIDGTASQPNELFVFEATDDPADPLRSVPVSTTEFEIPPGSLVLAIF